MSYYRVIPRDLFNEGNLLKCYGKLYIELEKIGMENRLIHVRPESNFEVVQDESGFTYLNNVYMTSIQFYRPLNSREDWPLYALNVETDDEYSVFDNEGNLDEEFKKFLNSSI